MRGIKLPILLASLTVALVAACGGGSTSSGPGQALRPSGATVLTGKITVFAAASLTDAFSEIGAAFEVKNRGLSLEFNFAGSPVLRTQLEQGARADVYASADTVQMANAVQSGVVAGPGTVFVRNSLVLITPSDNPGRITVPADLAKPGLKLVLANKDVPAGNYAHQVLALMEKDPSIGAGFSNRVLKNLVSEESDVKQVVAKVQLGEADAGVVYGTDVTPSVAHKLKTVAVPAQFNVKAEYLIAPVKGASNPAAAQGFIDFVLSSDGQAILKRFGFQTLTPS